MNYVNMGQAFSLFWGRYFEFNGRSSRSEYWWWMLWAIIIGIVVKLLNTATMLPFSSIWALATFVPMGALGTRRMRDCGVNTVVASIIGVLYTACMGMYSVMSFSIMLVPASVIFLSIGGVFGLVIFICGFIPSKVTKQTVKEQNVNRIV